MAQQRDLKPVLSRDLTEAVNLVINDAMDSGIDLNDIEDSPKFKARRKNVSEGLDELVELKSQGSPIPGQSLTNSPDTPYPWETPAEFANPRDALAHITNQLLQPEAVRTMVDALSEGASVGDLAISIAYAKFVEGKISPNSLLLLVEPIMYVIMAIGEEANIAYNIDGDDIDEEDSEEIAEKLKEAETIFEQIKSGAMSNIQEGAIPNDIREQIANEDIPSLLAAREPEEKSLLDRGDK